MSVCRLQSMDLKTSEIVLRCLGTLKLITHSFFLFFRHSSVIDEQPTTPYYEAVTSTTSRIDPEFYKARTTYKSNSQNRVTSPPPSSGKILDLENSSSSSGLTFMRPSRGSTTNYSLDNNNDSASSIRLDNYVTLRRRRPDFVYSPSASPMVLSPSATLTSTFPYPNATSPPVSVTSMATSNPASSREGSLTPRFSHSCSNASIVSELTEN